MATKKLNGPIRITVTERGRHFQRELRKELKFNESFRFSPSGARANKSGSPPNVGGGGSFSNRDSNLEMSRREIIRRSVPPDPNSSRHHNNKSLNRSQIKESEFIKLPKIHFKQGLEQNPFIKDKLEKLNRDISRMELQTEKGFKGNTETVSNLLPSDSRNFLSSIHDQSMNGQMSERNDLNDKFMVRHYVKMLHSESEVEMIMKRHQKNQEMWKRIQEDVHKRYRKMKVFQDEEDSKPPALLDDIREKHTEAIEALQRKTGCFRRWQVRQRKEAREKYQDVWSRFQDLSRKK